MGGPGNGTGHGGVVANKHPGNSAINKSGKGQHLDNNSNSTASKTFASNYQNSETSNAANSHGNNNSSSLTISDLSSR